MSEERELYPLEMDWTPPPGATLVEFMDDAGLTIFDVSFEAGLDTDFLYLLVQGRELLTPDVAMALERATEIPVRMWLALEKNYRATPNGAIRILGDAPDTVMGQVRSTLGTEEE